MTRPVRGGTELLASNLWFGSRHAHELGAGTLALEAAAASTAGVSRFFVDPEAGSEPEHGIRDFELYRESLRVMRAHLERRAPARVVLLGGGCAATAAVVPYLRSIYPSLRVIWIDAHGDLNSPASSSSHYLHGMALRLLLDAELYGLFFADAWLLSPDRATLVGQKELDPTELAFIASHGMELRPSPNRESARGGEASASRPSGSASAQRVSSGAAAPAASRLSAEVDRELPAYIHLDLDALHPHHWLNPKCRIDAGLDLRSLEELLAGLAASARIVGYSIAENFETDPVRVQRVVELFRRAAF